MIRKSLLLAFCLSLTQWSLAQSGHCVDIFDNQISSSNSTRHLELAVFGDAFKQSKTNWFLAAELTGAQASQPVLHERMKQVFEYEKNRLSQTTGAANLSRYGEAGGVVTDFQQVKESAVPWYAKPAWSETPASLFALIPNEVLPEAAPTMGTWKGRTYIAAGDLILREPTMAGENTDALVFRFAGERIERIQSFTEFIIERLPFDVVTVYRAAGKNELELWQRKDFATLLSVGQKRIDDGVAHTYFKVPGSYFSIEVPATEFAPEGGLIKVRIHRSKLIEMAKKNQLYAGTHQTLDEIYFLPDAWRQLIPHAEIIQP